jgi:F420-non-reducing hydrogenase iron-sulfur subunit
MTAMTPRKSFEPKIVSFICDWCSLQSADFIGLTRIYFPRMVSFIRVSCSGRVNPEMLTEALLRGCDGALIMGCRKGSCNYLTGNYQAERVVKAFKKALEVISVDPARVLLNLESDTEIIRVYEQFLRTVKRLGPLWPEDEAEKEELRQRIALAGETLLDPDLKWLVAREWTLVSRENAYGEITSQEKFDETLNRRIGELFLMSKISHLMKGKTYTVVEICQELGEAPDRVFSTIVEMKRRGKLADAGIRGRDPVYRPVA